MSGLAAEIQRTTLDRNEAEIAAGIAARIGRSPLDDESRRSLVPFVEWCNTHAVRYCAAKPATVAAFVFHQKRLGAADGVVLATLDAVTRLHDAHRLSKLDSRSTMTRGNQVDRLQCRKLETTPAPTGQGYDSREARRRR